MIFWLTVQPLLFQRIAAGPAFPEKLKPTLTQAEHGDGADTAAELGIARGTFAVEQHRARRRLADLLREEVAQTVIDPADTDAELMHLLRVLAQAEVAA